MQMSIKIPTHGHYGPEGHHHHKEVDFESDTVRYATRHHYLHGLLAIEMLRQIKPCDVGLAVAWQYGQNYQTPWRDTKPLVEKFLHTHKAELTAFVNFKAMKMIKELLENTEHFGTAAYTLTPLDPGQVASIRSALDSLKYETLIHEMLKDEYRIAKAFENTHVKFSKSHYANLEFLDKMLISNFEQADIHQSQYVKGDHYKRTGMEPLIFDNKVTQCFKCLEKVYGYQLREAQKNVYYNNFGFWASILSIFYRLVLPVGLAPHKLDDYYTHEILHNPRAQKAITFGRMFSALPIEAALCSGTELPTVNINYLWEKNKPQQYSMDMTDPDSLVERYLTTQYLRSNLEKQYKGQNV
jgi:hypothetical protein